jgi:hypothetical protein
MRLAPTLGGFIALVVIGALWVSQCSGPRPVIQGVEVEEPEESGEPYRVTATITNAGPGHGESRVLFRLREPASMRAFQYEESLQFGQGDTLRVVAEISAPPGDYTPEVEVEYPPR